MKSLIPPRRSEFIQEDLGECYQILDNAKIASLATVDEEGWPEVRPMNFARLGNCLFFHTGPGGVLQKRQGQAACVNVAEGLNWIPSNWRHSDLACPATTYYASVVARGPLTLVEDLNERACALQGFMEKYQTEGGYAPIADLESRTLLDERYRGPLEGLVIFKLELSDTQTKVKYGQHLNDSNRQKVYQGLLARANPNDLETAGRMLKYNPEFEAALKAKLVKGPCQGQWCEDPNLLSSEEIWQLLRDQYWAHKRSPEITERNRQEAEAQIGLLIDGQLKAYARIKSGWLFDVIVHPSLRGQGVGQQMLDRILSAPAAKKPPMMFLQTRDACGLYEKKGFKTVDTVPTGSYLMVRYTPGYWPNA
jgi:nitroimidazol reductase NimA-like FMN-containing flavoprotein (pyridoxamine 5'-phosphate oxidase superfamily)/GNAT superfamily N-acetyltransferase